MTTKKAAQSKKQRYLKSIGRSGYMDVGPVREHIARLHDAGMSIKQIAQEAGVHKTRVTVINKGIDRGQPIRYVCWATYAAIMAVRYTPPTSRGSRMDPTGTRRRVEALRADGFPVWLMAELTGICSTNIAYISRSTRTYVHRSTVDRIAAMYVDVGMKKPEDYGVTPHQILRTKGYADRRGFAPRMCWDDDTLDDPAAFAEWTGKCGSPDGYRLHFRRDIPVCEPCKKAHSEYNAANKAKARRRAKGEA